MLSPAMRAHLCWIWAPEHESAGWMDDKYGRRNMRTESVNLPIQPFWFGHCSSTGRFLDPSCLRGTHPASDFWIVSAARPIHWIHTGLPRGDMHSESINLPIQPFWFRHCSTGRFLVPFICANPFHIRLPCARALYPQHDGATRHSEGSSGTFQLPDVSHHTKQLGPKQILGSVENRTPDQSKIRPN